MTCDLILGDILNEMPKLKNDSIDLTVTSPPYDSLRTYDDSLEWNGSIWKFCIDNLYRVTKIGGVVVWVVNDSTINGSETLTSFEQAMYFKQVGFNVHDTMIYAKNNYMPLNHNRYDPAFEYMFVFSKGKPKTFNPLKMSCKTFGDSYNYKTRSSSSLLENGAMRKRDEELKTKEFKYRSNIWYYDTGKNKGTKDDVWIHPATFPEKLAEDHILSWSNIGDTIFDPFMGSCTTGKMAYINKRNFKGIEKVKKFYDLSVERMKQVKESESLNIF